jgi:nucleoside recognition membrane protein YjiH
MQLPATRFLTYSLAGIVAFFVPVSIGGSSTILIDHIVGFLTNRFMPISLGYTAALIVLGVALPFFSGEWKRSRTSMVLSVLQLAALPLAAMYFLGRGPEAIMQLRIVGGDWAIDGASDATGMEDAGAFGH